MPRGGHMGLWKPTPKDIYKSRWKRFYKRCYRLRTPGNNVDRPGPHDQSNFVPDGVPSAWKLNYSLQNFTGKKPPDSRRAGFATYRFNIDKYLLPAKLCREGSVADIVHRCLDGGRHGSWHTGLGRLEATWGRGEFADKRLDEELQIPMHIYNQVKKQESDDTSQKDSDVLDMFPVRRLYQLCDEKEIIWDGGLNDPRKYDTAEGGPRGRFPYVDDHAGLLDELSLSEILRVSHRTNSRRHPKWKEIQYWFKRWHRMYLRRRHMLKDEVKARMGIMKQAVLDT